MSPAIRCKDLYKRYDNKVDAVNGLNLEIQMGECFGLLGPKKAIETNDCYTHAQIGFHAGHHH